MAAYSDDWWVVVKAAATASRWVASLAERMADVKAGLWVDGMVSRAAALKDALTAVMLAACSALVMDETRAVLKVGDWDGTTDCLLVVWTAVKTAARTDQRLALRKVGL